MRGETVQEIPKPYLQFKARFPQILQKNEELGTFIHEHGGPLDVMTRWLVKLVISAVGRHQTVVVTHAN